MGIRRQLFKGYGWTANRRWCHGYCHVFPCILHTKHHIQIFIFNVTLVRFDFYHQIIFAKSFQMINNEQMSQIKNFLFGYHDLYKISYFLVWENNWWNKAKKQDDKYPFLFEEWNFWQLCLQAKLKSNINIIRCHFLSWFQNGIKNNQHFCKIEG